MFAGLSLGTMMTSRFLTNTWGVPETSPSFTAVSISSWAAEANTSAGAPCWIWASRSELAPKLCFTSTPWFCSSKVFPSSPKASVRDEAASMVSVPPCSPPPPPDPPLSEPPPLPPPHDTSPSATKKAHASTMGIDLIEYIINSPVSEIFRAPGTEQSGPCRPY